ncbi:unnamed protein product, partial [Closterium sp. NIES-54]
PSKKPSRRRSSRRKGWATVTSSWAAVFVVALGLLTWTLYLYSATHRLLSPSSASGSTRSTPRKLQQTTPRGNSGQQLVGGSRVRRKEEGGAADREAVRVEEDGDMGQRQGVAGDKGVEDGGERGENGVDGREEGKEGQQRQGEERQENEKQQGQGWGRTYGEGGGEGKRNGSEPEQGKGEREGVMGTLEAQAKALQQQKAEVQSWEEEVIKRIGAVEKREWDVAKREKEMEAKWTEMKERKEEERVKAWEREGEEEEGGVGGLMRGSEVTITDVTKGGLQTNSSAAVEIMKGVTLLKAGKGRPGAAAAAGGGGRGRGGGTGGGGGRGRQHDVMEALQMLKLNLRALEENVETVLLTESSLHPHAFNTTAAFLHLPPGSVETPPPTAAAAAAELYGSPAAAAPKASEAPKQYVREAVAGPLVIAGMVYNRMFDGDYTRFWALHVWQWLEYHRYAGVTRFYWYDEARSAEEDQDVVLAPYIDAGLVVYHRVREMPFVEGNFTAYLERMFRCKQGAAYNHWVKHYASEVHWAFHTDIDEYFFTPCGTPPGFLRHYLQTLPNTTVQVLIQNMFFLGDPIGSDTDTLLERYTLRMPDSSGRHRTKPIAWLPLAAHLMDDCINPHEWAVMENGPPPLVDMEKMRLNHYWGDRAGVISDNTPVYTMDVTMMDEYGDGLVKDESAQ